MIYTFFYDLCIFLLSMFFVLLKTLICILLLFVIVFLVKKNTKNSEYYRQKFDAKFINGQNFAANRGGDENWINCQTFVLFFNNLWVIASYTSETLTLLVQGQHWKDQNNMRNLFKVNSKDTRTTSMTSFWCLYC